jgi:hypothetical protein
MLHIISVFVAVETLAGVATCGEGLEVHMNLMSPGVSKVSFFLSILWISRAASYGRHKSLPNFIFCYL